MLRCTEAQNRDCSGCRKPLFFGESSHMKKLIPIVAAAFLFAGCDNGDADIDLEEGANNTEELLEDTGDAIEDAAETAGDKLENAAEETREGVEEAVDEVDRKVDVDVD